MSETDEGLAPPATWSGMFSQPGREQRRLDERKGVKTRAQREAEKKRPPQKTAQINFRATPEFKALCDLVARRLDEPVAEMFVIAVHKVAAEHGINIANPEL